VGIILADHRQRGFGRNEAGIQALVRTIHVKVISYLRS
jgi:hypothetical protein